MDGLTVMQEGGGSAYSPSGAQGEGGECVSAQFNSLRAFDAEVKYPAVYGGSLSLCGEFVNQLAWYDGIKHLDIGIMSCQVREGCIEIFSQSVYPVGNWC